MEENYSVFRGNETIGLAQVAKEGLYYHIRCQCRKENDDIIRLLASCDSGTVKLGVLIPDGESLFLQTRIAAKHFPGKIEKICVEEAEHFVPIKEGEAFSYLSALRTSKLVYRGGQAGILLSDGKLQSNRAVV